VEIGPLSFAVRRPIRGDAVLKLWSERLILAKATLAASEPGVPFALRAVCLSAARAIEGRAFSDFDVDDPAQLGRMQVFFAALQSVVIEGVAVMTAEDVAATLALADTTATGAELLGRAPNETDIINIRTEIG
jgi:hypothetical protein